MKPDPEKPIGWAACATAYQRLANRVAALEARKAKDERWLDIADAPRLEEDGPVPAEYVLLLWDPDNEALYRRQMGYWNHRLRCWESCDKDAELKDPTRWMHVPAGPEDE